MAKSEKAPVKKIFTFEELEIPVGAKLYHKDDQRHTCVVLDDKRAVRYEFGDIKDESRKITELTNYVYSVIYNTDLHGRFAPLRNWLYEGEILQQRKERLEENKKIVEKERQTINRSEKEGIVYIISNPRMEGLIKIGMTRDSVEQRINNLSSVTGVPARFELRFAGRVDDCKKTENILHTAFKKERINEKKEFFEMSYERAKELLEACGCEAVAIKNEDIIESEEEKENLADAHIKERRNIENFNFNMIEIKEGEKLIFLDDENTTCTVAPKSDTNENRKKIIYEGREMTLSAAAGEVLTKKERELSNVRGPYYWYYKGKSLMDLRDEMDSK